MRTLTNTLQLFRSDSHTERPLASVIRSQPYEEPTRDAAVSWFNSGPKDPDVWPPPPDRDPDVWPPPTPVEHK